MRSLSFLRMRPWRSCAERKIKSNKGATSLVTVFLFFIFSTLGLSMLYLSQIYLKLSACKKYSTLLKYASENGIKQGLDHFLDLVSQTASPSLLSPDELCELRESCRSKDLKIVKKILGKSLPLENTQSWEIFEWESLTDFFQEKFEEQENSFHSVFKVKILSEGRLTHLKQKRESSLEMMMGISAGNVPLPYFPLLIGKKLESMQQEKFDIQNNIQILSLNKSLLPPRISFSEDTLLPKQAEALLAQALKIKFFKPESLSNRCLRTSLGLDATDEPVPDGVYLIKDDTGMGGVYVQGDLKEMVTAIEEDFQVLSFLTEEGSYVLKFSPQKSKSVFITPWEAQHFDLTPLGIVVINGEVCSLGGGVVGLSGQIEMVREEEVPSILQGVSLTLISPQRITISSHLIHQGVKWVDKVPYVKGTKSQLFIFSTGQSLDGQEESDGEIIIDANSPQEIKIQAALTASGEGLTIKGREKSVHILGSLQIADYSSNENALSLIYSQGIFENDSLVQHAPQTAKPVIWLSFLKPVVWKEN